MKKSEFNILLLNPPSSSNIEYVREGRCMQRKGAWSTLWPPISLAYISSLLKKNHFSVNALDCVADKISLEALKLKISEFSPNLVIINTSTPSIESDLDMADFVKATSPDAFCAFFGLHVSSLYNDILISRKSADFILVGEPEFSSLELSNYLYDHWDVLSDPAAKSAKLNLCGVAFYDYKSDAVVLSDKINSLGNLDKLPFPDWSEFNLSNYVLPDTGERFLLVATSRGCPYNCNFCASKAYYGSKLRLRNPLSVVDEIRSNIDNLDVKNFLFWSEGFTIDRNYAESICDELIELKKEGYIFRWICNSRVDNVDYLLLKKMKSAGCYMIGFGIESFNQDILDLVKKGLKVRQIKKAIRLSHYVGLETVGHVILGLPGDSVESIKNTLFWCKKLPLDFAQFYCAVPFPGSDLYSYVLDNGYLDVKPWKYFEQNMCVINYDNLSASDIMRLRAYAYKTFYLRPKIIFNNLRRIRNFNDFRYLVKMGLNFLGWIK